MYDSLVTASIGLGRFPLIFFKNHHSGIRSTSIREKIDGNYFTKLLETLIAKLLSIFKSDKFPFFERTSQLFSEVLEYKPNVSQM